MKRRDFLNKIAITTAGGAGLVTIVAGISTVMPPATESYNLIKVGHLDDYPLNEFSFIPDKKIYLFRTRRDLRVLSAVCTHLGCTVNKSEQGFDCPCHGSYFDKTGKACAGPASRSLDRLQVAVSEEGLITVNLKQIVQSDFELP
jgi:cytochrome b6-f complex iron-sulfur subunit